MIKRLFWLATVCLLARRLRQLVEVGLSDDSGGSNVRIGELLTVRADYSRQARARVVRDSKAEREAAHVVPPRPRSSHRRPPDHRPSRPEHDHPPAPADRRGRDDLRDGDVHGARSLPSGRRRLPEHHRPAAELPALRLAPCPRCLQPTTSASVRVDRRRRRLPDQPQDEAEPPCNPGRLPSDHASPTLGRPARFTPWFGALAHAIFFRAGSLDYFHTHVCAPARPAARASWAPPR